jgi:hypothetical protein
MKRSLLLLTALILVACLGYTVLAERNEPQIPPMPSCPMCMAMCKSVMEKALVATEDGGVILMAGCKLMKFDKDLNKVKEVQIEMNLEEMQTKMQKMMQSCPFCPMMKMQKGMAPMKAPEKQPTEHTTHEHPR